MWSMIVSKAGKQIVVAYGAGKLTTLSYATHNEVYVGDFLMLKRRYQTDEDGVMRVTIEVDPGHRAERLP